MDVFVFVAREEVLDSGGSQFVSDGEGASGYAPYQGGGEEGGVPDHHVGGPLRVSI